MKEGVHVLNVGSEGESGHWVGDLELEGEVNACEQAQCWDL